VGTRQAGRVQMINDERGGAGSATGSAALVSGAQSPTNPRTSGPRVNPTCVCNDALGEPMDINGVAALLGCSAWTVRQKYLASGLPHFRIAKTGKLIFYRNQIVRWVLEQQERERR
jgi:hypothetical protein